MIEVHKVKGEVYCDCCKQRATVRIVAANFSACNPTNIALCEDCSKLLKEKL